MRKCTCKQLTHCTEGAKLDRKIHICNINYLTESFIIDNYLLILHSKKISYKNLDSNDTESTPDDS